LLSEQGHRQPLPRRPIAIRARLSGTAGPFVCSTADFYQNKAIDNHFQDRQHDRLLSEQGYRPSSLRSSASTTTDRLLSEQGYQEQQDHSQGRLHQQPIAIRARLSTIIFKIV